jgi:hypothetical protein
MNGKEDRDSTLTDDELSPEELAIVAGGIPSDPNPQKIPSGGTEPVGGPRDPREGKGQSPTHDMTGLENKDIRRDRQA